MRRRTADLSILRVRHTAARVAVAVLIIVGVPASLRAGPPELEYAVKAEFIERFTHFIDWPAAVLGPSDAPFVLCVVGESPLLPYLEAIANARRIKNRRVELRRLKPSGDFSACHLLYIAADERQQLKLILGHTDGLPIVTVADTEGFGRAGVLINLELDAEGRIGFEISSRGARKSALTFNAQLLRLARLAQESRP